MVSHSKTTNSKMVSEGSSTFAEIFQQPELWPLTAEIVRKSDVVEDYLRRPVIVTGAGTSAYAARAIAAAWPGAQAIPTTDLLLASRDELERQHPGVTESGVLISLGRSGDSPESVAVIERFNRLCPKISHLAITCNEQGQLTRTPRVRAIVLDPRTNDRGLAMTSSFSNLVLAGLCLRFGGEIEAFLPSVCADVKRRLPEMDALAERLSADETERAVILASGVLQPLATETALKILEMTAGHTATLAETFLGLRHGPMSFLRADTLVLCLLSSSADRRRYEQDLLAELRQKGLGRLVGIVPAEADQALFDYSIPASAGQVRDELRVPFEIPFAQLLAYHLSLREGLDPDSPSPMGAITRVVQKFVIYDDEPHV